MLLPFWVLDYQCRSILNNDALKISQEGKKAPCSYSWGIFIATFLKFILLSSQPRKDLVLELNWNFKSRSWVPVGLIFQISCVTDSTKWNLGGIPLFLAVESPVSKIAYLFSVRFFQLHHLCTIVPSKMH